MPGHLSQLIPGRHVPVTQGRIIPGGDNRLSIGSKRHVVHRSRVSRERLDGDGRRPGPHADGLVRSTGHQFATGRSKHNVVQGGFTFQFVKHGPILRVEHLQGARRADRGEPRSLRTVRDVVDGARRFDLCGRCRIRQVPLVDEFVDAASRQLSIVRLDGDGRQGLSRPLKAADCRPVRIPQFCELVAAGGNELRAGSDERHIIAATLMRNDHLRCGRMPDSDGPVAAGAQQL